ncbi:MAG: hypothetical protein ACK5MY_09680 [Jhaorihella sp.]
MNRWFLKMARWAHRPPSARQLRIVLAVIAACLVVFGAEWLGLWPDWATAERMPR